MISTIEFLMLLESSATYLTYETEKTNGDREVLDTGGCWPKELQRSSQYGEHKKTHMGAKYDPKDYGMREDVTVTGSLRRSGGCRQDGLGTTAVLEPKS